MKTTIQQRKSRRVVRALNRSFGAGFFTLLLLTISVQPSDGRIEASRIASGLSLPLYVCAPPGDTGRIFIAEQHGMIKIFDFRSHTILSTPFLDITNEVGTLQGNGILGMAFDPDYASNGHFYVSYTTDTGGVFDNGVSHIARFTVTADPDVADPASEVTVLTSDRPGPGHEVDWIGFSPRPGDHGNLYICSGDGGGSEDKGTGHQKPDGNGQSTTTLLGKILRIHVEADGTYTIPPDNPFFGSTTDKQEIFQYGLRNPFRVSFDPQTGNMFIGDVGEMDREEIDINFSSNPGGGENFGWRYREGFIQNPYYADHPPPAGATDPIFDYTHADTGICVIGGYIYRGRAVPDLRGLYVFADCFGPDNGDFTGRIFTLKVNGGVASDFQDITSQLFPTRVGGFTLTGVTSLGQDARGEIYITTLGGDVFQIKGGRGGTD